MFPWVEVVLMFVVLGSGAWLLIKAVDPKPPPTYFDNMVKSAASVNELIKMAPEKWRFDVRRYIRDGHAEGEFARVLQDSPRVKAVINRGLDLLERDLRRKADKLARRRRLA